MIANAKLRRYYEVFKQLPEDSKQIAFVNLATGCGMPLLCAFTAHSLILTDPGLYERLYPELLSISGCSPKAFQWALKTVEDYVNQPDE